MNKIGWKYGLFGLLAWLFVSCQQEGLTDMGQGYLTVSLLEEATGEATKATPAQLEKEIEGLFHLTIRNASGYTVYDDAFTDGSIRVAAGTYTVTATYGNNQPLALDAPYYTGESAQIQVTAGSTQATEVTCRLANALISIDWTDKSAFDAIYSNYGISVESDGSSVKLSPTDTKSAYLKSGATYQLTFVGTRQSDQSIVSIPISSTELPTTLTAGEQLILKLTADTQTGLSIQKAEVNTATIRQTIPLRFLPAPKVTAKNFNGTELSFYETDAPLAQLDFQLASSLQDLAFTLNFQDENLQSLNGDYRLTTLTPEQRRQLVAAGFILPTIGVQAGAFLGMDNLLQNLHASNDGDVVNTIVLTSLQANDRDITEPITYTISVKKPIFSISVDERNCWSREFSIDEATVHTGKVNTIKSNLVYQYYDGNEWKDCTDRNGVTGRLQQFQAIAEDLIRKTYPVRALYRRAIISTGDISATLENPDQLPNSDMEEWQLQDVIWEYPNYLPWNQGAEALWNTNNEFTFRYPVSLPTSATSYNGFPAVSYSTVYKHGGNRSAELRNTGAGPAGISSRIYDGNKTAGMLFLGDYTGTTETLKADGSITIDEGRTFSSRPTQIRYWYMYEPYETDTYDMIVKAFDVENNVIGTCSYNSSEQQTDWKRITLDIDYTSEAKVAKFYVLFESSNAGLGNVPCGMQRKVTLGDDQERTTHYGSVLRIDDISLIYEK